MFDRRSVIRREWAVWWRYALTALVCWVITLGMIAIWPSPTPSMRLAVMCSLSVGVTQLILLGIITLVLLSVLLPSHQPYLIALFSNVAAIGTMLAAGGAAFVLAPVAGCAVAVAHTIYLRLTLLDFYSLANQSRCTTCYYDLRGLTSAVCPECSTPIPTTAAST